MELLESIGAQLAGSDGRRPLHLEDEDAYYRAMGGWGLSEAAGAVLRRWWRLGTAIFGRLKRREVLSRHVARRI